MRGFLKIICVLMVFGLPKAFAALNEDEKLIYACLQALDSVPSDGKDILKSVGYGDDKSKYDNFFKVKHGVHSGDPGAVSTFERGTYTIDSNGIVFESAGAGSQATVKEDADGHRDVTRVDIKIGVKGKITPMSGTVAAKNIFLDRIGSLIENVHAKIQSFDGRKEINGLNRSRTTKVFRAALEKCNFPAVKARDNRVKMFFDAKYVPIEERGYFGIESLEPDAKGKPYLDFISAPSTRKTQAPAAAPGVVDDNG